MGRSAADHVPMLRMPRPLGVVLIALLLAAVMFLSLPGATYAQRVLQDAGHGPVFFGIAVVLVSMAGRAGQSATRAGPDYLRAFLVAVGLGVATELLQHFQPGRSVSLLDVLHDAAGAALGLALVALILARRASVSCGPAVAVALSAMLVLAWQPLQCARAYAERSAAYPTLAPMGRVADEVFATARNGTLSETDLPPRWRRSGDPERAWRLDYRPGTRPALELVEAAPDWRGYAVLALDLTNPGPHDARYTLRILDAHHDWTHGDRLNLPVVLPAGTRTTVRVATAAIAAAPRHRRMDLAAIANVMLFAPQPLPGEALYVSRIWLEK